MSHQANTDIANITLEVEWIHGRKEDVIMDRNLDTATVANFVSQGSKAVQRTERMVPLSPICGQ